MSSPLVPRLVTSFRPRLFAALSYLVVGVLMFIPMPSSGGPPTLPHLDKLVHVACWGLLGFATWLVVARQRWLWAVGLAALFGVLVELGQGLTSTRSADLWDGLADLIGAALGATFTHLMNARTGAPP